jgi:hypothetical protein
MKYTNSVTLQDAIDYLHFALAGFELDPADTAYQRGYEAALREMRADLLGWPFAATARPALGRQNGRPEFLGKTPAR